jgi:hypothetical protein
MNFGLAVKQLRDDGIGARFLVVTDGIASAPPGDISLAMCGHVVAELIEERRR